MMREFTRAVVADFAEMVDMIGQTLAGYWRELGELGDDPARTRQGIVAACSVMLATTLALVLEVDFAVVGGDQRVHVADGDRCRLAASRDAPNDRDDRRRRAGLRDGALAALRPFRALPVPRRHDDAGRDRHAGESARARLAVPQHHLEHGAADEPERPLAGGPRGLLPDVRSGDRRRLGHHRGQPAAGLARRSAADGAGMAPPAGRAMARRPARRALGDRRRRGAGALDHDRPAAGDADGHHDRGGDVGAGHRRRRPQHAPGRRDAIPAAHHRAACWAASWR